MRGILLLSGGFDSPVAFHLVKDKLNMSAIHFHYYPVTGKESLEKAKELAKILGFTKLTVYPIAPIEAEVLKNCDKKYFFVLSKRFMVRIAEIEANNSGAECIITGESLGQVGSQTLQNLFVISNAVKIPIYRPLLTMNKEEIINKAKQIGTYELSKGPEICNILGPKHPITNAKLTNVEKEESKLDITELVSLCIVSKEIIDLD